MLRGATSGEPVGWVMVGIWFLTNKLLHCEPYVTWRIVEVQEPILSPFYYPYLTNGVPQSLHII